MMDSLKRTEYYYHSENVLQNVAVWEFPEDQASTPPAPGTKKYWLIFIHGGAWRDPRATLDEALPTFAALVDPPPGAAGGHHHHHLPRAASRLAGLASLNYRLAPHPDFAQALADPSFPAFAARRARHPEPLADVLRGLRFLQRRFGFGRRYVLFGHSAGACLAYQTLLGRSCLLLGGHDDDHDDDDDDDGFFDDVVRPAAVVGFEGIYDLRGLDARMGGAYASFLEPAFGPDVGGAWNAASPATAAGSYRAWCGGGGGGGGEGDEGIHGGPGRLAVLAQSPGDELVDMAECDAMEKRLRADGVPEVRVFRDLEGGHFEVLNDGSFARVLARTWEELERLDRA